MNMIDYHKALNIGFFDSDIHDGYRPAPETKPTTVAELAESAHMDLANYNAHIIDGAVTDDTQTIAIYDNPLALVIVCNINDYTVDNIKTALAEYLGAPADNDFYLDPHIISVYNVHPGYTTQRAIKYGWGHLVNSLPRKGAQL